MRLASGLSLVCFAALGAAGLLTSPLQAQISMPTLEIATLKGVASADLSVTKVDTPDPVVPGGNITYTITVTNAGPSAAANVSFSDTVPAGTFAVSLVSPGGWSCPTVPTGLVAGSVITCSAPSLGVGSSVFTLTVATFPSLTTGAVVSNTASVTSSTLDPNPGNESATATTTVAANPGGVSLIKSSFPPGVGAGTGLLYFLTATNASGGNLGSATLTDTLPPGTTFGSFFTAPPGWSCVTPPVSFPGTITCSTAPFVPGNTEFAFPVIVNASVPAGTVLSNTAHLVVTDGATVITRDATATSTVFTSEVVIYGTKTVSGGNHTPGSALTYTIVLHNNGDTAQPDNLGNELTDVLPAGLTLVGATASSGTVNATVATRTVTWNGSIPAGGSVTIDIDATIDANVATGTILTNQATVAFDSDADGSNNATRLTDDPAVAGAADPTSFQVGARSIAEVPTLDTLGLALLALLLAIGGSLLLRRRVSIRR